MIKLRWKLTEDEPTCRLANLADHFYDSKHARATFRVSVHTPLARACCRHGMMNRPLYLFFRSYDSAPWRTESRGSSGSINKVDLSTPSKHVQLPERNHLDVTIKFTVVIVRPSDFFAHTHSRNPSRSYVTLKTAWGQPSKTHGNICMNVCRVKGSSAVRYPAPAILIFNDRCPFDIPASIFLGW